MSSWILVRGKQTLGLAANVNQIVTNTASRFSGTQAIITGTVDFDYVPRSGSAGPKQNDFLVEIDENKTELQRLLLTGNPQLTGRLPSQWNGPFKK